MVVCDLHGGRVCCDMDNRMVKPLVDRRPLCPNCEIEMYFISGQPDSISVISKDENVSLLELKYYCWNCKNHFYLRTWEGNHVD